MQHNLAVDNLIHEQHVPRHVLAGWGHTHEWPQVRAADTGTRRDDVAFRDLLFNGMLRVRKGGAQERVALHGFIQPGMLLECRKVLLIKRG